MRVVAARPRLVRVEKGPGPELPDALEDEGEGEPEQHVETHGRQNREHVDLGVQPHPADDRADREQR